MTFDPGLYLVLFGAGCKRTGRVLDVFGLGSRWGRVPGPEERVSVTVSVKLVALSTVLGALVFCVHLQVC